MGELRNSVQNLDDETLSILVTGFGVFRGFEDENPSFKIAQILPSTISGSSKDHALANVTVHPQPVRVSYEAVDEFAAGLYSNNIGCPYDIVLHIGVAGSIQGFQVEQRARRDKFPLQDVDGEFPSPSTLFDLSAFPTELQTPAQLEDVLKRWQREVPDALLAVSTDAGRYLCEYIYYHSLAKTCQWRDSVTALFLHVPSNLDPEAIEHGREVALGLLRAVIESKANAERQLASVTPN